ncbi:serine hydrolase [Halobellus marinus]|uniref:serine hydrolase n=1 Tax=Halobellus marinus TaxID=3075123 RepID=UPI0028B0DACF|nr:serine hydrolase [Halobellus sp. DFY28]
MATGQTGDIEAVPEQPYYAASIGKSFTSTIVGILSDDGQLSFDDPIAEHLSNSVLDGLHTIDGTDYTDEIRIRHLLGHTSGLPHSLPEGGKMFLNTRLEESPEGKTLFDEMLADPDRTWEPEETIEWATRNQSPTSRLGRTATIRSSGTICSD